MSVKERLLAIKSELPQGVELVAVSKFHPVETVMEAYDAGQRIFGESRAQELVVKVGQVPDDVRWHFIGHLQTNKVRQVVSCAHVIESVDSVRLLRLIDKEAVRAGRAIDVLLQLHVAKEQAKTGFAVEELLTALSLGEMDGLEAVRIRGLMAMATLTDDEAQIDHEFALVKSTFDLVKEEFFAENGQFDQISMGMTDDWHIAVRHGSTLVRIGTAIFGQRQYK